MYRNDPYFTLWQQYMARQNQQVNPMLGVWDPMDYEELMEEDQGFYPSSEESVDIFEEPNINYPTLQVLIPPEEVPEATGEEIVNQGK